MEAVWSTGSLQPYVTECLQMKQIHETHIVIDPFYHGQLKILLRLKLNTWTEYNNNKLASHRA